MWTAEEHAVKLTLKKEKLMIQKKYTLVIIEAFTLKWMTEL